VFNLNVFLATVKIDNPTFKKWAVSSSLDPLIQQLKTNSHNTPQGKAKIQRLIAFMPFAKQTSYSRSLAYLTTTLGVHVGAIPANAVMEFNKFLILSGMYKGYNAAGESRNIVLDAATPGSLGPRSFIHRHTLSWTSSNGNPASLANVRTREYVKFLADTQAPPFNKIQDPDREFYAPGNMGSSGSTSGVDDHSTKLPSLICCNPRQAGSLRGEQKYQFSLDNGATWQDIDNGQFLLEKTVRLVGQDWVLTFKKTNWAPHNTKKFHFEVEYTVGPAPEYMPRTDKDVLAGPSQDADIKHWARRVVAEG
jgi:hypothetical protein